MILLCITSIYATISNQKNTDENIESITAAQDRPEATLREVMGNEQPDGDFSS